MSFRPYIIAWTLSDLSIIPKNDVLGVNRGNIFSPYNTLYFQFNPSEVEENATAEWETKDISGGKNPTTFKSAKPRTLQFELFLNEWGDYVDQKNNRLIKRGVEEQISWLKARLLPRKYNGTNASPPLLLFGWNQFDVVILTELNIKRTHFRPAGFADLSTGFIGPREDKPNTINIRGGLERREQLPHVTELNNPNSFVGKQNPGDAIRATVGVKLLEYVYSTASSRTASDTHITEAEKKQ